MVKVPTVTAAQTASVTISRLRALLTLLSLREKSGIPADYSCAADISHHSWANMSCTYLVDICRRNGRSFGGGSGRYDLSPFNIFWKRLGMPGKTHSFPSRRTTGYMRRSWHR